MYREYFNKKLKSINNEFKLLQQTNNPNKRKQKTIFKNIYDIKEFCDDMN